MALFKKKEKALDQKVVKSIGDVPIEFTMESIEKRINTLLKVEEKVLARISRFEENTVDMQDKMNDLIKEIKDELGKNREDYKKIISAFNEIIKGVSFTSKIEDFEKAKRIVDDYDFADMTTRNEFKKMVD